MRLVKTISVIPASDEWEQQGNPGVLSPRKRVAAYARVSTDSEEQLSSYEAQVDHYTRFIKEHAEWEFIEVYADAFLTPVLKPLFNESARKARLTNLAINKKGSGNEAEEEIKNRIGLETLEAALKKMAVE